MTARPTHFEVVPEAAKNRLLLNFFLLLWSHCYAFKCCCKGLVLRTVPSTLLLCVLPYCYKREARSNSDYRCRCIVLLLQSVLRAAHVQQGSHGLGTDMCVTAGQVLAHWKLWHRPADAALSLLFVAPEKGTVRNVQAGLPASMQLSTPEPLGPAPQNKGGKLQTASMIEHVAASWLIAHQNVPTFHLHNK